MKLGFLIFRINIVFFLNEKQNEQVLNPRMSEEQLTPKPKSPAVRIPTDRPRRSSISGNESPLMKKENGKKQEGGDVKRSLEESRYSFSIFYENTLLFFFPFTAFPSFKRQLNFHIC